MPLLFAPSRTLVRQFLPFCAGLLFATTAIATPLSSCLGFKPRDKVLIVEAADVGMQPDIDAAAFRLIETGTIQTLAIMPVGNESDMALRRAKARDLGVGVSLALTNEWQDKLPWRGVLPVQSVPSLYNSQGNLWRTPAELALHATEEDARQELLAQIARVKESGVKITHLESRNAFWRASPMLTRLYLSLAQQTGYPVVTSLSEMPLDKQLALNRNGQRAGIVTPDTASSLFDVTTDKPGERFDDYGRLLRSLPAGINLLSIYPAQSSVAARTALSDLPLRTSDFAIWSNGDITKTALQNRIRFSNFAAMQSLQDKINADTDECLAQAINR
ncbi:MULTISPECIES: ChbG/HpnK family deacetylase [Silvimonas]|uniref:ChbG/HpnK family deacetylase n=1 Tax=Silvimonas TaxID=300264 RepID=UPI0024B33C8F|nr:MULTISPECIES: ChbG/HpnK family deacetylase [Silvimonas]MDR3426654.1 ChbG/HpnK family deacetylase [Silvimonas sp.]